MVLGKRKRSSAPTRYARKRRRVTYRRRKSAPIGKLALRLFESKKKQYSETETAINSITGWYANGACMALSQNDSYSGMEGHIIRGKGISIRGWIKNNATTTQCVRLGVANVLRGSSKSTDFYAGTDVIENDSGNQDIKAVSSTARMTGRFNQDQYKMVKQFFFKLGSNSASDGSDVRTFKMWIPLNGMAFRYDGSGVLPTANLYTFFVLNCLGNNDESLGENTEISFTSTFYYVDP